MFLSVIVPHYNLPCELLERCLESIMAQGLSDEESEVIVVDDGSAEPPVWITEKYKDIQLITAGHHGLGSARNTGMENAKGEYILFVDSDDYLQPDSLKKCIATIKAEKVQILRFRFRRTDGKKAGRWEHVQNTISGAAYMTRNNLPACAWSYIFSRKLADKYGIRFQTGIYHEDEEFTTKLHYHASSLADSKEIVYNYYIRPGSIVQNRNSETIDKRLNDYLAILDNIKEFKEKNSPQACALQKSGIDRKLATLTADTIYNMLHLGKTPEETYRICDSRLRDSGLYPLPKRNYSTRYKIFRLLANSMAGIRILHLFIHRNSGKTQ